MSYSKITVQEFKGNHKGSMDVTKVEYIHALPAQVIAPPDNWVKVENVTYKRFSGNKKLYRVIAVNAKENEKIVSLEMMVEPYVAQEKFKIGDIGHLWRNAGNYSSDGLRVTILEIRERVYQVERNVDGAILYPDKTQVLTADEYRSTLNADRVKQGKKPVY